MNNYLAKSHPIETIQQHTDKLLKNYEKLKYIYPNLDIDWDILYRACVYHDLGKMNLKFQDKIEKRKIWKNEIPHGILSLAFIDYEELEELGYTDEKIKILFHSIGYHHERELNYTDEGLEEEIELLKNEFENFKYDKLDSQVILDEIEESFFIKNDRIYQQNNEKIFFEYILIKGLLNRLDYAASGYIDVEKENNFLINSLENLLQEWKEYDPKSNWNKLQMHMIENRDNNVIAIAETGMGKTEAGLLWIGDHKGFFTLPLKTAINAMYDRVANKIIKKDFDNKVGLLHSDTYSEYFNRNLEEIEIDEYYNKTKQLSLPLTICTLDQIFDFVYRYRGFEPKLATLAYSKIVIDEVQMYAPDLLAYLIVGLSYVNKVGGKFAILTATLPPIVEDLLKREGIDFVPSKTFTKENRIRHSMRVIEKKLDTKYVVDLYNKNKVLVICNTVKEAQRIYQELKENYSIENVNLFHSNFIKRDRKEKEKQILKIGDKDLKGDGIWVTTQVVEASLDIDFDILITELSDLNGLFQRMGRCYRSRPFNQEGYNCYVFNGGEKDCNGVGYFIDKDIFKLSKKALKNIDGKLEEKQKMELVKSLYTIEQLKDTKYYKDIVDNIKYVKSITDYELSKSETKKRFRNIKSTTIIPKNIYDENIEEIKRYVQVLSIQYDQVLTQEERKELRNKKIRARSDLMNFTASVPDREVKNNIVDQVEISKYESIPILNCNYSSKIGIQYIKPNITPRDFSDKFI
ncbi:CRISPR-associated helicase Cas3' [Brassicibacter mesophilus]|uniref:CRISPR-associated helicase Cas3' n=1 Tax=Brassicibacter mesophilus TaxID=745119 RepID=UPI003D2193D2